MTTTLRIAAAAAVLVLTSITGAQARPHAAPTQQIIVCNQQGCSDARALAAPAAKSKSARRAASTRHNKQSRRRTFDANHNAAVRLVTIDTAANIKITVHPAFAEKFRALIADMVAHGYKPRSIGCYAHGHKPGSNHAIGAACDFDQSRWGKTAAFMYRAGAMIRSHGLFDGGSFTDWGHVEAMRGLHNRPPSLYAAVESFKRRAAGNAE